MQIIALACSLMLSGLFTTPAIADRWSTDMFGNTTGTIGGESFRSSTDMFGNTTTTIGGETTRCSTDMFGNTSCY